MILVSAKNEEKAAPYVDALQSGGAPAERIRVVDRTADPARVWELAMAASGLLLSGGADVDPQLYGEEVLPLGRVEVDSERDAVEWALLKGAQAAHVPVFAICRGLQVVNVYRGGTLWQDIPTQVRFSLDHSPKGEPREALVHEVEIADAGTALGNLLGPGRLRVNSRHHQAIKDLAPDLVAAAVSPDGVIEACELPVDAGWWLRAVQWHPENLVHLPEQRELFAAFTRQTLGTR